MNNSGWLSRNSYLVILFFIVIIIAISGYGFVRQQTQIAIDDTRHELTTIADLKSSQIIAWRRGRLIEASSLNANAMFAHRIKEHLKGNEEEKVRREILGWMKEYRATSGYSRLKLFRPDGTLAISDPEDHSTQSPHYLGMVQTAVRTGQVFLSDLHYDEGSESIDIDLAVPLMYREEGRSTCVAVLLIEIDPHKYLYPLIRTWPTPSFSGENVLVRRDGDHALFLNTLRFKPDSALRLRVPLTRTDMPAVQGALGREGIFEGVDYRGELVYAAVRIIPDSNWAIISKIDRKEMLEPVSKRIWYVVGTCLLIVLACALALSMKWKRKREDYLKQLYDRELEYNRELRRAEYSLQEVNNSLEERVAQRTEELSSSNAKLRQEIAERKQVEELLRKYFHVILQSPIAIIITDLNGTIEFVNPKFTEYSGYSYEEAIGQNPRILKSEVTPPETFKRLWETISKGGTWQGELCNRKKNGELYWEFAKILPIKDQSGTITNYMGFKEDITWHKQLEDKMLQSRKLETIGQIAGGVAHEVRNPLNAILSITEALFREKEIDGNPEFTPYIDHIRAQVNRLANLMTDLLDLGKAVSPAEFQTLRLLDICRETIELWKSSGMAHNRHAALASEADSEEMLVKGDHNRLQQVIFNLLENAGHHCPAECAITLQLAGKTPDGKMAVLRVIDSGKGIPEKNIFRIFEPFFSDRKGGTGLGLPLVKHFIENMGGSVRIWNNDPPPGCTAELHIPLAARDLT